MSELLWTNVQAICAVDIAANDNIRRNCLFLRGQEPGAPLALGYFAPSARSYARERPRRSQVSGLRDHRPCLARHLLPASDFHIMEDEFPFYGI